MTPYLPLAFANGELTANDILDIEEIIVVDPVDPDPEELEKIRTEVSAILYSTGESMDRFGSFSLTHQNYTWVEPVEDEDGEIEEPEERDPIPTVIEL